MGENRGQDTLSNLFRAASASALESERTSDAESMDAPTLQADAARAVAAQFQKARTMEQQRHQLDNEDSLKPRRMMDDIADFKQYNHHGWTPHRGTGQNEEDRVKFGRPALVATGKNAGESRVHYTSNSVLLWHMLSQDFFLTVIQLPMRWLIFWAISFYLVSFFFFSAIWYIIWKANPECVYGLNGFWNVFNFSVVTQQTIGYGNSGPNNCAAASFILVAQSLFGMVLDALTLGVLFARISHPYQRAHSIFLSESAVILRRDGILKFCFRCADVKTTQVVEPKISAYLYGWGNGRTTAEGEFLPCRSEQLELDNIQGQLLLPLTLEHTIDERSPLCGHTYESLMKLSAEIIVTFEGTTEMGNPFMARQSYLPTEIKWGYQFVRCIHRPHKGDTSYTVDIAKFHQVEPQADMPPLPQEELSKLVVTRAKRTVPYPLLGENTLVLSDTMVLTEEDGALSLIVRVGDTYPNQTLDTIVRVYLYRWPGHPLNKTADSRSKDYTITELDCGYDTGADRMLLWLPVLVRHRITADSPLASWQNMSGFLADADSCIAVVVEGYMYTNSQNRMRMRIYNCFNDIKLHQHFQPIVSSPSKETDFKPNVDWSHFHHTVINDTKSLPMDLHPSKQIGHAPIRTNSAGRSRSLPRAANSRVPEGGSGSIARAGGEISGGALSKPSMIHENEPSELSPLQSPSEPLAAYLDFHSSQAPLGHATGMASTTMEATQLVPTLLPHLNSGSSFMRRRGVSGSELTDELGFLEDLEVNGATSKSEGGGRLSAAAREKLGMLRGTGSSMTLPNGPSHFFSQRAALPKEWTVSSDLETPPNRAV